MSTTWLTAKMEIHLQKLGSGHPDAVDVIRFYTRRLVRVRVSHLSSQQAMPAATHEVPLFFPYL